MIRSFLIEIDKTDEVVDFLLENVGPENVRWWRAPVRSQWDGIAARNNFSFDFFIDLTEEEEPMLTAFILKYS